MFHSRRAFNFNAWKRSGEFDFLRFPLAEAAGGIWEKPPALARMNYEHLEAIQRLDSPLLTG